MGNAVQTVPTTRKMERRFQSIAPGVAPGSPHARQQQGALVAVLFRRFVRRRTAVCYRRIRPIAAGSALRALRLSPPPGLKAGFLAEITMKTAALTLADFICSFSAVYGVGDDCAETRLSRAVEHASSMDCFKPSIIPSSIGHGSGVCSAMSVNPTGGTWPQQT